MYTEKETTERFKRKVKERETELQQKKGRQTNSSKMEIEERQIQRVKSKE